MADIPAATLAAGAEAVNEAHAKRGWNKPAPWWTTEVATAVLDAAAPLLAEETAELREKARRQAAQIDHMRQVLERKNRQLDALGGLVIGILLVLLDCGSFGLFVAYA